MAEIYDPAPDIYVIREQMVKSSGRYDLVDIQDGVYCNNGIDFFIHQGQRALERRLNIHPTKAKWYTDLGVGEYICQIENLRAVQEVWAIDEDGRDKLIKYDHWDFPEESRTKAFDTADRGKPTHYYPTGLRLSDVDNAGDSVTDTEYGEGHLDTHDNYDENDPKLKGVIVWPPADQTYTIEVIGLYYDDFPLGECVGGEGGPGLGMSGSSRVARKSDPGSGIMRAYDSYSTYWMQEYPNLLIMAALQQLEYLYRGSKTAQRWDDIIEREIVNLEKDAIEEEVANVTKMLG